MADFFNDVNVVNICLYFCFGAGPFLRYSTLCIYLFLGHSDQNLSVLKHSISRTEEVEGEVIALVTVKLLVGAVGVGF